MKKSIFILVALFAATFANAALIPDYKFINPGTEDFIYPAQWMFNSLQMEGNSSSNSHVPYTYHIGTDLPCPFYVKIVEDSSAQDGVRYIILNATDYSIYKSSLDIVSMFGEDKHPVVAAYDIFAVDKLAFIIENNNIGSSSYSNEHYYQIIDEDNNILLDFSTASWYINKYGDTWKLLLVKFGDTKVESEIYVLPGDGSMPGSSQAISNPAAQRNAKKIVREGQVLVETENNTYNLKGQEVK